MKFARYLQDTQTPEWKKAYIDYGGLKKRIKAIKKWQEGENPSSSSGEDSPAKSGGDGGDSDHTDVAEDELAGVHALSKAIPVNMNSNTFAGPSGRGADSEEEADAEDDAEDEMNDVASGGEVKRPPITWQNYGSTAQRSQTLPPTSSARRPEPLAIPSRGPLSLRRPSLASSNRPPRPTQEPVTLHQLLPTLPPVHLAFFAYLDKQLEKIESFYGDREKEAVARSKALEVQLTEMQVHRKLYNEAHPHSKLSWSASAKTNLKSLPGTISSSVAAHSPLPTAASTLRDRRSRISSKLNWRDSQTTVGAALSNGKGKEVSEYDGEAAVDPKEGRRPAKEELDPDDYLHARKKLKQAVLEHYRGLDILKNYRIMNITGFRKALKKYEKITGVPAQHAYMTEKVEASAFASGELVDAMRKETEEAYAARFEKGNKKAAMDRLRNASVHKSHHFSSFKSGAALGIALPAVVSGIYHAFQPNRAGEPYQGLLLIYGAFAIPVIFALLVGLNILVWSDARINYVFIFELDLRTKLDHREYFQVPSFLFLALAGAFWLSFSDIGSPTLWPLVWLGVVFVVMFNPLPIFFKSSRWWLLRSVGELLISGVHRVEFTDFWMGDQFCSLVFTITHLYFTGCAYRLGFPPNVFTACGVQTHQGWSVQFVLAIIPFVVRLVQSIRRYADSGLPTHLVNGGKYTMGIVYYLAYFIWRFHGQSNRGAPFIAWCFFGTVYSVYACTWDYLMDWSLFKPHARYPLLRSDLVYTNEIPMYYFALVSNLLIRFIWVLYIPVAGPSIVLRTFIGGFLEMLRRWQWNFYRLENEHTGNMDQYRISREVPLPYTVDVDAREDGEDGDEDAISQRSLWLPGVRRRKSERGTILRRMSSPVVGAERSGVAA